MKAELEALARHRLARAREALGEGEHLLVTGALMGAVNRFSYGAFHAARSLLATRQADSPRHRGSRRRFVALLRRARGCWSD